MNTYQQDLAQAKRIAESVAQRGGRAYFVGGFVRDYLMKRDCKDIDIEVYNLAPQSLRSILSEMGEVLDKGASFGVLGLAHSNLDIAMPRTESRTGAKHTDFDVSVNPYLPPKEACRRRDFTVNAMLMDVLTGEILDFYGGQDDLQARVIRCVAADTFVEDALRVFRAAQFAARFDAEIEENTLRLCASMDVTALSTERVFAEMEKALLKAEKPSIFFRELRKMNHLREFFSEIEEMAEIPQNPRFHPEGDVFEHTMLVLDEAAKLRSRADWQLGLMASALWHDVGKCVATEIQEDGRITAYGHEVKGLDLCEKAMRRVTNHEKLIAYVKNMSMLHMRPNMLCAANSRKKKTRAMFDLSLCPNDLILLSRADASGKLDEPYDEKTEAWLRERLADYEARMRRPMVTGSDLIAAGRKPGADFGELLRRARRLHLSGVDKKQALRQVLAEAAKNESENSEENE